jgi:hypothetical protein
MITNDITALMLGALGRALAERRLACCCTTLGLLT